MTPAVYRVIALKLLTCLVVTSWCCAPLYAQTPDTAPVQPQLPTVPSEQTSPRRVLRTFLERMERDEKKAAAELLDLSKLNAEAAAAKGPELAYKLFSVMQRLVKIPSNQSWPQVNEDSLFESVPAEADHDGPWSLDELERYASKDAELIEISRNAEGRWLFSTDTVARIEGLFQQTENQTPITEQAADAQTTEPFSVWFRKLFPEPLRAAPFLLPNYQWLCLIVIALAGRLVEMITRWTLTKTSDALLHWIDAESKESTKGIWKPVGRLAHAATWYGGAYAIGLPLNVVGILLVVLKLVTIVAAVMAAFAVIDLLAGHLSRRAKRRARKSDDLIVPLAKSTTKVVVCIVAAIASVAAFSEELPSTLLGGLGIGGVALALASQETLSNFFGSVAVLFDRPFEVGDWVLVEGIEGEVESVGFRSTRIRTGLNSQVSLPNSKLAAASVDNWGRRKYRRYMTRIGVEYDTPRERIDAFCEGIRELIRRQPHTRKDFYAAYFNDFGASALEILLVVYFEASDWATELRERHRLLGDIVELAERLEVGFAFPTQTVHLHQAEASASTERQLTNPEFAGQELAAEIAGELLNYQDRPGPVKFSGPTKIAKAGHRNGRA